MSPATITRRRTLLDRILGRPGRLATLDVQLRLDSTGFAQAMRAAQPDWTLHAPGHHRAWSAALREAVDASEQTGVRQTVRPASDGCWTVTPTDRPPRRLLP